MGKTVKVISLRTAALIAGFTTLVMVFCAPFAELYCYPKLVIPDNAIETIKNINAHRDLFATLIISYALTFLGDIITAWALYILLKPVNNYLSLLAASLRAVFAVIAIVSLLNLVNVFRMVPFSDQAQIMFSLNSFRYGFHFGLIFFGLYLVLLGYLVWNSKYIPWIMGLFLIISGIGYFVSALQPYLFPELNTSLATYTFYGELLFMIWLIIKGWKIPEF